MIRVGLTYDGQGHFTAASRHALEELNKRFKRGDVVKAEVTRPRSVDQNRLFHLLCEAAFDHQVTGPTFATWRHLKSWVLIRCGHCEEYDFEPEAMTPEVARVLRRKFDFVEVVKRESDGHVLMRFAKSVGFNDVSHEDMSKLVDQALHVISEELVPGATKERLLEEAA